jgi:hypothetical protein
VILEGPSSVAVSKIATPFRHPCANLSLALRLFLTAKGSKTWRSMAITRSDTYTRSETGAFWLTSWPLETRILLLYGGWVLVCTLLDGQFS